MGSRWTRWTRGLRAHFRSLRTAVQPTRLKDGSHRQEQNITTKIETLPISPSQLQPGALKWEIRVSQLSVVVWLAVKYWLTYQNVQSSAGSTVMLV